MMKIKGLFIIILWVSGLNVQAQTKLELNRLDSELSISGTSTVHDWDIEVEEYTGYVDTDFSEEEPILVDGEMEITVKSFMSGKKSMDKVVYKALEENEHAKIHFRYHETLKQDWSESSLRMVINGDLTIAGTTRNIEVEIEGTYENGKLLFEGIKSFKMSEYEIEPPTAMFGTIKSGDKIQVEYSIIFQN